MSPIDKRLEKMIGLLLKSIKINGLYFMFEEIISPSPFNLQNNLCIKEESDSFVRHISWFQPPCVSCIWSFLHNVLTTSRTHEPSYVYAPGLQYNVTQQNTTGGVSEFIGCGPDFMYTWTTLCSFISSYMYHVL